MTACIRPDDDHLSDAFIMTGHAFADKLRNDDIV
jgi:hypothetical protein